MIKITRPSPHILKPVEVFLWLSLFILFGLAATRIWTYDIFWQLQMGRYTVQSGHFIRQELFSLAEEATRYDDRFSWLHGVIFYGSYCLLGYKGISLLKGLLIAATSFTLFRVARSRGASASAILLCALPSILLTYWAWDDRPQLWSFLFFSLFLFLLEKHRREGGKSILLLFPLMILWANLHGGSVLAFPLVAAYLAGEGVRRFFAPASAPPGGFRLLLLAALSLLAAATVNPYGIELLRILLQVFKYNGGDTSGISLFANNLDWKATTFQLFPGFYYALGGCLLLLGLAWKRLSPTDLFLLAGLAVMGSKVYRHSPFFLFAVAALLPAYASSIIGALSSRLPDWRGAAAKGLLLVAALFLSIYIGRPAFNSYGFFRTGIQEWSYPTKAVEFVKEQSLPGNMFNAMHWGGYLMWRLYPDYRVFWDGRQNAPRMFELGLQVERGAANWQEILDDYGVNFVVYPLLSIDRGGSYPIFAKLRGSAYWAPVYADDVSVIFIRRSAADSSWLTQHELAANRLDDAILENAALFTGVEPAYFYLAYREMARIYLARKEYRLALDALGNYLSLSPERDTWAESMYRLLSPLVKQ